MSKKEQSLYYDDSAGIYAFMPFERFDQFGKAAFKVGNTEQSFQKRLGAYHTYFFEGVWVVALIKVYAKRGKKLPVNFKQILNTIENFVLLEIKLEGGEIIYDKRRKWKTGQTEWVYTDPFTVKKIFQKAIVHFRKIHKDLGFLLDSVDINKSIKSINNSYNERKKIKNKYIGEYIFNLSSSNNKKT